jgi:hypothetical protein
LQIHFARKIVLKTFAFGLILICSGFDSYVFTKNMDVFVCPIDSIILHRRVNAPLKGGGFKLRLKAGLVGPLGRLMRAFQLPFSEN